MRWKIAGSLVLLMAWCLVGLAHPARAEDSAAQLAFKAAIKAATFGPSDIALDDQAVLHLPDTMLFVPKAEAAALMRSMGNSDSAGFKGIVMPKADSEYWMITLDQTADGFVKDEDAKNWNAAELLQSLKDGTEAQNEERIKLKMPALDVVGWLQLPTYDAATHRLIWSLKAVERGAPADAPATVNYNTYALGRDGYFELDLLTDMKSVEADKVNAKKMLAAFEYKPGKRYEDFNGSTDHIAEYGLAALIGGVVAKKLGLLALGGVLFAKFFKVILIGLAVAGGTITKIFRRKDKPSA